MYGTLDNVCLLTLAPELPNARIVIAELCKKNIKVSLGKESMKILYLSYVSSLRNALSNRFRFSVQMF